MVLFWRAAAASLAILVSSGGCALAAVDAPVRQADELTRAGKAREAYALLAPLTAQRAGDPDFDYALGLAAVDSGRPAEAIIALQRVLALQPNNAPARAELARAYALAGDADTARQEFDTVVGDPSLPDPVRQRFVGILNELDRTIDGGGSSISGFVEAGGGYDSNINTATSATSLVIPLFSGLGPASLSGSATQDEDAFARLDGGVSLVHGLSRQSRAFASLLGSLKENLDDDDFDQANLTATGGYAYTLASRKVLSASLQGQAFWISGSRYRDSVGATVQITTPLANGAAVSLVGQYFDISYPTDPTRDGNRYAVGASYAWRSGVASVQVGQETTDNPAGDHFSNNFLGLSGAYEYPLNATMTLVGSLAAEKRDYDAADPLFLVKREDKQFDVGIGARVSINERLILRPQVTYTRNSSNVALYDYDRVTAAISLRTDF